MILRHPPSRRLSPGASLALVVAGLGVLPLVPGLAQSPRERPPANALSVERVVTESPSCRACHDSAKPEAWKEWRFGRGGTHPDKMHDEIVKLLDVLKVQRDSVARTEKHLRDLLDHFEKATGKKPAGPKEADKRLDDLEKKLEGILKELQDLRKERRVPRSAVPGPVNGQAIYVNQRAFQIPIQIQPERKTEVRELLLHMSKDQGKTWEVYGRALPTAKAFDFLAESDGVYAFRVRLVDQNGRKDSSVPDEPAIVVHIDTVKPFINLLEANGKDGKLTVRWKVTEENPDLQSLKLSYRPAGSDRWVAVPVTPSLSGLHVLHETPTIAEVRLSIADLAGHSAVETVTLVTAESRPARNGGS